MGNYDMLISDNLVNFKDRANNGHALILLTLICFEFQLTQHFLLNNEIYIGSGVQPLKSIYDYILREYQQIKKAGQIGCGYRQEIPH